MNNFGVIEVATTRTTNAPGWAYVPDTVVATSNVLPGNRKRTARNTSTAGAISGSAESSARLDAKIRKEIEALDRDNARDVSIPLPSRGGGNRAASKHTANVRKILQSQKTFANHLDDFIHALEHNPNVAFFPLPTNQPVPAPAPATPVSKAKKRAPVKRASVSAAIEPKGDTNATAANENGGDVEMADAPAVAALPPEPKIPLLDPLPDSLKPPAHPGDTHPLLISRAPPMPTAAEIESLVTARPLTYDQARAEWPDSLELGVTPGERALEASRRRQFCEVCGYWGRVKCTKCGSRVCALDCLETHREECSRRYGL